MNPAKINKEDVATAMNVLESKGISLSADNIRAQIGRGSKQTVLKLKASVETDRQVAEMDREAADAIELLENFPLPEALQNLVATISTQLEGLPLAYANSAAKTRTELRRREDQLLAAAEIRHKAELMAKDEAQAALTDSHQAETAALRESLAVAEERSTYLEAQNGALTTDRQALHEQLVERDEKLEAAELRIVELTDKLAARSETDDRLVAFLASQKILPPAPLTDIPAALPPALARSAKRQKATGKSNPATD